MKTVPGMELFLEENPPYIIAPVEDPTAVEDVLEQYGYTVGDGWWASQPDQLQQDGRWKLYVIRGDQYQTRVPSCCS